MQYEVQKLKDQSIKTYNNILQNISNGVFLYGAGFVGKWSVTYLENLGIKIIGFIDSDKRKWGKTIAGKIIFSPEDTAVINAKIILITSRHAVPLIRKQLAYLPAHILSVDAFTVHHQSLEVVEQIESLLSHDQKSLDTFNAILSCMLSGYKTQLSGTASNLSFFNEFGFFNSDRETFVDAGAYVGDSVERFIWSMNGVFEKIYAFEPGKKQFNAMKVRMERLRAEWSIAHNKIILENKGLSNKAGSSLVKEGQHIIQTEIEEVFTEVNMSKDGFDTISTIEIDTYFQERPFTFLKVDVEGSEKNLLEGAKKTIKRWRPKIALSVYHFPTDIFELPLICSSYNPEYQFTLGHHSSQLMDTVLYCRDKNE